MSGFLITLNGPLHWQAKRQKITARSSAEAEIYAADEYVKQILFIKNIIDDLHLSKTLLSQPITIYNNNMACIHWSRNSTSKNIRHLQILDNAIRESVQDNTIRIVHIDGKVNPADIFTKEEKDASHFILLRNKLLKIPYPSKR